MGGSVIVSDSSSFETAQTAQTAHADAQARADPFVHRRGKMRSCLFSASPLIRRGSLTMENAPASFPDIVAERRVRIDGLAAVMGSHLPHR